MNGSCVSFRQRHPYDRAYVQIAKSTCAGVSCECSSNVGMVTARGTVGVSRTFLSSNCTNIGSILHELGHVLGRYHEHSRIDRDNYVEILYQNIYAYAISNFFIYLDTNTPIAYDYNSIMHYDSRAYSINGLATIRPLNTTTHPFGAVASPKAPLAGTPLAHMGQRLYLTELDYANINFMYNCSTRPSSVTPNVTLLSTHTPLETLISPTTTHPPNLPDTTFVTPGLVLTSQPTHPCHPCGAVAFGTSAVDCVTPVYTPNRTPLPPLRCCGLRHKCCGLRHTLQPPVVYSLNSQGCICQILCMYYCIFLSSFFINNIL